MTTNINNFELADKSNIKQKLREQMQAIRKVQSPSELRNMSLIIQNHILQLPLWHKSACIILYSSINNEVDTSLLLQAAWNKGVKLLLPRCIPNEKHRMEFAFYSGPNTLSPGKFKIPEPDPSICPTVDLKEVSPDLIIVPGLAFTRKGVRLGHGGGYYDYFLNNYLKNPSQKIPFLLGLGFSFQILDFLPEDIWDKKMDALCTENGLILCQ